VLVVSTALSVAIDRGLTPVLADVLVPTPMVAAPASSNASSRPDLAASTGTLTRHVVIAAVDPVTGDRAQIECDVPAATFASDLVIVDANDFAAVTRACLLDGGVAP
jgi:hypothetical protein